MFPDLLATAIEALDVGADELLEYRVAVAPDGWDGGAPTWSGDQWGAWTIWTAPLVIDHLEDAGRVVPASADGDALRGQIQVYGSPVAALAALAGAPPSSYRAELRHAGREYAVESVSDWRGRAGFIRVLGVAIDR